MDKFGEAYREALETVPGLRMNAEQVQDELHHRRMQRQRRRQMAAKGCTAAAVFLLCSGGVAAAKSYRDSRIEVKENGFVITGSQAGLDCAPMAYMADGAEDMTPKLRAGGVSSDGDMIPEAEEDVIYEPEPTEYASLAEFMEKENIIAAIPDRMLLGKDFTEERVIVSEDDRDVYVMLQGEDAGFFLHQLDTRGYEGYSYAASYMGESKNERNYTNRQGLSYVVFDIVDAEGTVQSVHAVISLEGRDLSMDFEGFSEEEIERILNNLDLTVYFESQGNKG